MFNREENGNIIKNESVSNKKENKHIKAFEKTLHNSEAWINEIQSEIDWLSNDKIYHLLRAVLHAIRNQLSIDEAAQFSAQLPLLLKGTFYECWNPSKNKAKGLTKEEFLKSVLQNLDHPDNLSYNLETGVTITLGVIMNHISAGEIEDIIQTSKNSLKLFLLTIENFNLGVKFQ